MDSVVQLVGEGEDVDVPQGRELVRVAGDGLLDCHVELGVVDAGELAHLDVAGDLGVLVDRVGLPGHVLQDGEGV